MREITVGVAVQTRAQVPWQYALDVAAGSAARLRAVLVNDSFDFRALDLAHGDAVADPLSQVRALWKAKADQVQGRLEEGARKRGVRLEVERTEGRIVDGILKAGRHSGLVVVGRGRRSRAQPGSLGSRVELLLRRHAGAILLTPLDYEPPRRVVAAYAGKALGERVLSLGVELARALGAGLVVLTAGRAKDEVLGIQQRARDWLSHKSADVDYVVGLGKPEVVIASKVREDDVLVMGPHGRSPLYRMIFGRVTDRVIRTVPCALALTSKAVEVPERGSTLDTDAAWGYSPLAAG